MIKRYDKTTFHSHTTRAEMIERPKGKYIKYTDHQAEVKRLRKALEDIQKICASREIYPGSKIYWMVKKALTTGDE